MSKKGKEGSGRWGESSGKPGERRGEDVEKSLDRWVEKVVYINRCAKVVQGGRRFSFSALVVSGNQRGSVGVGTGKAKEVSEAIRKATEASRKRIWSVSLYGDTIPHGVLGRSDGGKVILRPACPGTGVVAGGALRPVLEVVGVKDVLSKSLGSDNPSAMVRATIHALLQLRTREQIWALRRGAGHPTVA
ncbi:MAG: 30S ribosomal protein S5 [Puniceicoccales bacterium]|jgi:small subunit ribosomal protein S5|nr:30S ribosomal protein S5 [Puniceicoccales bacterium]